MAIVRNKILYVLDDNNNYQAFTTVADEIFLTADKTMDDIYQLYGREYDIAVTSPLCKRVIRVYLLNKDETLRDDISQHVLSWNLSGTYQQGTTWTGNLTLMNYRSEWNPSPVTETVWKGSKFKIDIGIYYNDIVFWKERGIFVCGDISVDGSSGVVSIPIYDKFALLDGTISGKRISRFEIPVGTSIKTALSNCLNTKKDDISSPTVLQTSNVPVLSSAVSVTNLPSSGTGGLVYYVTRTGKYYFCQTNQNSVFVEFKVGNTYQLTNDEIYRFNGTRFVRVSDEVFDEKPIIFPVGFALTTSQPPDWSTRYTHYYTKSGDTYTQVTGASAPTWQADTYYERYLSQVTPYTIRKDENGTLGEIITELADIISCDVFYNSSGNLSLTVGAITNDDLVKRPVLWEFKDNDGFHSRPAYDIKFSSLVNQIIVAGNIENGYQYKAIIVNDNPRSQANIYMTDPSPLYIEDTQLVSDQLCETRGKYEMIKQGRLSAQLKFNSIFIPHLECNNLIILSDKKLGFNNTLFVINSIEVGSEMNMGLSVSSVNEVSF